MFFKPSLVALFLASVAVATNDPTTYPAGTSGGTSSSCTTTTVPASTPGGGGGGGGGYSYPSGPHTGGGETCAPTTITTTATITSTKATTVTVTVQPTSTPAPAPAPVSYQSAVYSNDVLTRCPQLVSGPLC